MKLPTPIKYLVPVLFAIVFAAAAQSQAADEKPALAKGIDAKDTIAVMDFSASNAPSGEAVVLSGFVRSAVVRVGKFRVVDKKNMENILAEQAFQQTGCTSQECAVKLGKILNVNKMIVGEYALMGGVKFLTGSLVDVESGEIIRAGKVKGFEVGDADQAADKLVAQLTGTAVAPVETPVAAPVAKGEDGLAPIERGHFGFALGGMFHPNKQSVWLRTMGSDSALHDYRKDLTNATGPLLVILSYRAPFREGMKWGSGVDMNFGYGPIFSGMHEQYFEISNLMGAHVGGGIIVFRNIMDMLCLYVGGGVSSYLDNQFKYVDESGITQNMHIDAGLRKYGRAGVEYYFGRHVSFQVEGQYGPQQTPKFPVDGPNQARMKYEPLSYSGALRYNF
jgi:hypothetical protein